MKMKIVVLVLGLILLAAVGLWGCGGKKELTKVAVDDNIPKLQKLVDKNDFSVESSENDGSTTTELTALADNQEEAEEIAELYGIELSSYSYGVATYTTDKNPQELIELGIENEYPALIQNYEQELYMEQ
ncbi:MAG: hypothetical protein HFI56_02335 [Lachnospiraceae bacterium]|nr:hypothetical protein [Lachnospiraceae bacterium]MCI9397262.1 hypothetical protein [Lachnospiraceae bacterium]